MLLRSMQNTRRGVSWCQSWKWCSAWWCCRWSSSVAHQSSLSVSAWSHHFASGADNAASPTGRHRWTGLFHPQREADHYAKTTGRNPRSILMSSVDRVVYIDGQLMQLLWAIHALPAEHKCSKVNKTEQSIYECLLGFCFNNIFCAATNFGCIDSFLLPQSGETKKWWVMAPFGATAAGLFWTVNVCWAHPVISRASAKGVSIFFMVLFPEEKKFAESCRK